MALGFIKLTGIAGFLAALSLLGLGALSAGVALLIGAVRKTLAATFLLVVAPASFVAAMGLLWALAIEYRWWAGKLRESSDEAAPAVVLSVLGVAVGLHLLARRWLATGRGAARPRA